MSYAGTRLCYDADSHIMELPDFFREFADAADRDAMPKLNTAAGSRIGPMIAEYAKAKKHSPEEVAAQVALGDRLVTGPKGYQALGAFDRDERRQALDQRREACRGRPSGLRARGRAALQWLGSLFRAWRADAGSGRYLRSVKALGRKRPGRRGP